MNFNLGIGTTRSLGHLQAYDVIEFESAQINRDLYMIVSIESDDSIPAIILQIWRFEGGYNHSFKNVMENDLGINRQVPYFEPEITTGIVEEITEYRSKTSKYSKKEELFFDVWPEETREEPEAEFDTPFRVRVTTETGEEELILPTWTPLQKLPIDRIGQGTEVEIWEVNGIRNLMKVTHL